MKQTLDNYTLRDALLGLGFKDVTSVDRTTKSWRLKHPSMAHWVSIKLGSIPSRPMSAAPLVVHPDDARKLRHAQMPGARVSDAPFVGGSTKYAATGSSYSLGYDVDVANEAALEGMLAILIGDPFAPSTCDVVTRREDPDLRPASERVHPGRMTPADAKRYLLGTGRYRYAATPTETVVGLQFLDGRQIALTMTDSVPRVRMEAGDWLSDDVRQRFRDIQEYAPQDGRHLNIGRNAPRLALGNRMVKVVVPSLEQLQQLLAAYENGLGHIKKAATSSRGRLSAAILNSVTPQYILGAIEDLVEGRARYPFRVSVDFDLLTDDGERLPPEAVFGVALSRVLGRDVGPEQFSSGIDSLCFRILTSAGYEVVAKGADSAESSDAGAFDMEGCEWQEGSRKLRSHLRSERRRGLVIAKRSSFKDAHEGRIFCERCGEDPVERYSTEHAESCIEVHHASTQVADMHPGHRTRLEELQCLCANCHRLVHRLLRLGVEAQ